MTDFDLFRNLFEGRDDAFGLVHGESVRRPLMTCDWDDHLHRPESSIGVYPMVEFDQWERGKWSEAHGFVGGKFYVKWGCSDIDMEHDQATALVLAQNLTAALAALGIKAWIERTKGKGFHVWVFADDWVPAVVMRRAFLVAHQVAGVAPTEVNPKQIDVKHLKVGLGNYVNLPYPHGWEATNRRCILLADGETTTAEWFLEQAAATRNTFSTLHSAAKLYKEPPKRERGPLVEPQAEAELLARALNGLAYKVWREGPLEGRDRSGTLARLAHLMAGDSIGEGAALVLLRDADTRWGKFADREDGEEQLLRLIERAYQ